MRNLYRKQGFTLVEMSVVIVVVGMILSGILVGQNIVKEAKLKAIIKEFGEINASVSSFLLEYDALPGDFNNAEAFWSTSVNGNGNHRIDWGAEEYAAWSQLNLANILPGSFSGVVGSGADAYDPHVNALGTDYSKNAGYMIKYTDVSGNTYDGMYGNSGNAIWLGRNSANGFHEPLLTIDEALHIEGKIDDKIANRGSIYVIRGGSVAADNVCTDQQWTVSRSTDVAFIMSDKTISCALIYWLD